MPLLQRTLSLLLAASLTIPATPAALASAYDGHPRLVILLVVDQFRADYLERYRADFKGRGFRLFTESGAYFTDCYYNYANTKTAPGHSTLGTGAYTDGHGISSNEWWDLSRNKTRPVTSVEDERFHIVGELHPDSEPGASPRNLRASTLGDQLRLGTQGQAKVFGVSLKDRAAILPVGFSANGAFWIDHANGAFLTSSYYMDSLPAWASEFNNGDRAALAEEEAGVPGTREFYNQVAATPAANSYELDFAKALITGEQLGNHPVTDMLSISISATDVVGHATGPDSPQSRQMVDALDRQLDSFFSWLDKNIPGGLANIYIVLSADHGVAPIPARATALGMPAATLDMKKLVSALNDAMNAKFSPGEQVAYLLPKQELPYLALNRPSFEVAGINEQEAEKAVEDAVQPAVETLAPAAGELAPLPPPPPPPAQPAAIPPEISAPTTAHTHSTARQRAKAHAASVAAKPLPPPPPPPPPIRRLKPIPVVVHTYTRMELASGQLPPSELGRQLAHSYSPNGGWYVMVIPEAFQMEAMGAGTGHFSPWSYDRHVPLAFFGAAFTPGVYHGRVQPVDLAATLASVLGLTQPSASIGTVLIQALHAPPVPPPATTGREKRRRPAQQEEAPANP